MNINEYELVKSMSYREYCEYLKKKYGTAPCDYMTPNWSKNRKVTRTQEGLFCHHIYEDTAIMLCNPEYAKWNPFEYQKAENLVYCDWLEHLLLHVLIVEYPSDDQNYFEAVGVGGAVNYMIPELSDYYSGAVTPTMKWRVSCWTKVMNDFECFRTICKRLENLLASKLPEYLE